MPPPADTRAAWEPVLLFCGAPFPVSRPTAASIIGAALQPMIYSAPALNISSRRSVLRNVKKHLWFRTVLDGTMQDTLEGPDCLWDRITSGSQRRFQTEFPTELETLNHFKQDFPKVRPVFLLHSLEVKVLSRLRTICHGNRLLLSLLPPEMPRQGRAEWIHAAAGKSARREGIRVIVGLPACPAGPAWNLIS
ncbi:MAG: hypothetical protein JWM59_313 [Verrucomicrobiales bacterium]|nr:hypothetical protein [Verrucomicrobiales bacterium]